MLEKYLRLGIIVTIVGLIVISCYEILVKRTITAYGVIFSFILGLSFILALMYIFGYILKKAGINGSDWQGIICESDWHPSLSRVQFFTWISVIGIVFVWVFLIKVISFLPGSAISGDVGSSTVTGIESMGLPANLFYLMGLTSFTAIAGKGLSSVKYKEKKAKSKQPINLWTMFLEDNRPSITRYQIFVWTSIAVLAYLGLTLATIFDNIGHHTILTMKIPDCPDFLLILMGVSQATYLGGKFAFQPVNTYITGIFPDNSPTKKDKFTIFGYGFEVAPGSVLIDETVLDETNILKWGDTKINLSLPNGINECKVRVITAKGNVTNPYKCGINTVDKNYVITSNETLALEGFRGSTTE